MEEKDELDQRKGDFGQEKGTRKYEGCWVQYLMGIPKC
jgi:hypothetical protein